MNVRPTSIGARPLWETASVTSFTNTQFNAIDTTLNSRDLYANCYTATIDERTDTHHWCGVANPFTMGASTKVCFGLFLTPDDDLKNMLFNCYGALSITPNASGALLYLNAYTVFGRLNGTSLVQSYTTPENLLQDDWTPLPTQGVNVANAVNKYTDCSPGVIVDPDVAYNRPWFFGWVIENGYTLAPEIRFHAYLSFFKYTKELSFHSPSGY